ncbi:MAG: hypothetical protein ACKVOU_06530 [Cytophagales bacterium]
MNRDQFHELLKNPSSVSALDADALEKLLVTFPYCNVANVLLAKVSSDKGSMFSNQKIKRAALFSPSRERLKSILLTKTDETEIKSENNKIEIQTQLISEDNQNPSLEEILVEREIILVEKKTFSDATIASQSLETDSKIYFHESSSDEASKEKMQNLRDEIQEVLKSLKGLETAFRDKISTESKKNPLDIIKDDADEMDTKISSNENIKFNIDDLLVDKPLKFYVHDANFGKSLKNASADLINEYLKFRPYEIEQKPDLSTQASIIEKFLESNISMPRFGDLAETNSKPDLSKLSTQLDDSLVSENMANIFEKQGKIKKAIEVYEKLKLKNPDKSTYFANKIENLNSLN